MTDLESRAAKVMNLSAGAGNTVIDNNLEEKIIIPASSAGKCGKLRPTIFLD